MDDAKTEGNGEDCVRTDDSGTVWITAVDDRVDRPATPIDSTELFDICPIRSALEEAADRNRNVTEETAAESAVDIGGRHLQDAVEGILDDLPNAGSGERSDGWYVTYNDETYLLEYAITRTEVHPLGDCESG